MLPRAPIESEGTFAGLSGSAILLGAFVDLALTEIFMRLLVVWLAPHVMSQDQAAVPPPGAALVASDPYLSRHMPAAARKLAGRGSGVVLPARPRAAGEQHGHGNRAGAPDLRPLPGSLEETADAVRALGRDALPLRLDLLDAASLAAAVDETEKRW